MWQQSQRCFVTLLVIVSATCTCTCVVMDFSIYTVGEPFMSISSALPELVEAVLEGVNTCSTQLTVEINIQFSAFHIKL